MFDNKHGPHGFFPMQLGQKLGRDGRYEIVRKLGWGCYASVWLARDRTSTESRYVAVKVLSTNGTAVAVKKIGFELDISKRMKDMAPRVRAQIPGAKHCAFPLDLFFAESIHGTHFCIVNPPCGSTLEVMQFAQPDRRLRLPFIRRAMRQTLLALCFFHNTLNAVHCDVKAGNILFKIKASDACISSYLQQHPSETYPPIYDERVSSDPIVTAKTQPLPNFGVQPGQVDTWELCLSDYGSAILMERMSSEARIFTPNLSRAPEQILGAEWGKPADVWSAGCMALECLMGPSRNPFIFSENPVSDHPNDAHLARIFHLLEPFPADFLQRCKNAGQYFDSAGMPLTQFPDKRSLEAWISSFEWVSREMSYEDLQSTCRFLRRCLTVDPTRRPTVSELLEDDWLISE